VGRERADTPSDAHQAEVDAGAPQLEGLHDTVALGRAYEGPGTCGSPTGPRKGRCRPSR